MALQVVTVSGLTLTTLLDVVGLNHSGSQRFGFIKEKAYFASLTYRES
jgi:hypothetical protein